MLALQIRSGVGISTDEILNFDEKNYLRLSQNKNQSNENPFHVNLFVNESSNQKAIGPEFRQSMTFKIIKRLFTRLTLIQCLTSR